MTADIISPDFFSRLGKKFISLKKLTGKIGPARLKELGLGKSSGQAEIANALGDLPPGYEYLKKGRVQYIIEGQPEDLVLSKVQARPGRTLGELARALPLTKKTLREMLNQMLAKGVLSARISSTDKVELHPGLAPRVDLGGPEEDKPPVPETTGERLQAFKKAHDQAGRGDYYVYIHQIRRILNWPRDLFDEFMDFLMVEGYVLANPGNPAGLAADEVKDCYQDNFGDLYITVNWRGDRE